MGQDPSISFLDDSSRDDARSHESDRMDGQVSNLTASNSDERGKGESVFLRPLEAEDDLLGHGNTQYSISQLNAVPYRADPEMFYSEEYVPRLTAMIDHVIDTEGPIHEEVLIRRIARHHEFKRAGRQIRDIVINIAKRRRGRSKEDIGLFFWRKGTIKDRVAPARYNGREPEMRRIEHICKEEIWAINESLTIKNSPKEIACRIGIARLTQKARNRLVEVIGLKNAT